MPYFAAALARTRAGWTGQELDLDGVDDMLVVMDLMQQVDESALYTLLFVEEDDEYLAIARVDDSDDLRLFVSDSRAGTTSRLGLMLLDGAESLDGQVYAEEDLLGELDEPVADGEQEDREERNDPDISPAGDPSIVADLGMPAGDLLALCAHEGTLPADVITEVCARAGCAEELEELREG